jgi:hypothetical protein
LADCVSSDASIIPSMRSRLRSMLNSGCRLDRTGCAGPPFDFFFSRPRTARKGLLLDGSI